MSLTLSDLNALHDTVYDALGLEESDEELIGRYDSLPSEIKMKSERNGCDDPVFQYDFYVFLQSVR
jgi:hypothetical protein